MSRIENSISPQIIFERENENEKSKTIEKVIEF